MVEVSVGLSRQLLRRDRDVHEAVASLWKESPSVLLGPVWDMPMWPPRFGAGPSSPTPLMRYLLQDLAEECGECVVALRCSEVPASTVVSGGARFQRARWCYFGPLAADELVVLVNDVWPMAHSTTIAFLACDSSRAVESSTLEERFVQEARLYVRGAADNTFLHVVSVRTPVETILDWVVQAANRAGETVEFIQSE